MTNSNRPFSNLAQDLVKLHPSAVTQAEQLSRDLKPRKKPMRVTVRQVTETRTVTIDSRVMATALELAGGDHRRLQILPEEGAVLVLNHPRTNKPQPNR